MLRIPHCLDNRLIDGGKAVSPTHPPHFTPLKHFYFSVSGTHFCLRLSKPQGVVRPEGLGKLKIFSSSGLEPATFRFAAQCLHHYATACPHCATCNVNIRYSFSTSWLYSKIIRTATNINWCWIFRFNLI
jgi:hypothetical protein